MLPARQSIAPAAADATDFGQYARLRSGAKDGDAATVREVARQFESLFTQMLLKASRSDALGGNDLLGGAGSDTYRDLFDQQMAGHLSAGKGLGLAELLTRQLLGEAPAAPTRVAGGLPLPGFGAGAGPGAMSGAPAPATATGPGLAPAAASAFGLARLAALRQAMSASPAAQGAETSAAAADPHAAPLKSAEAPSTPQAFVAAITPHAERAAARLGIPADVLIAQAALETGWGRKVIANADGSSSHNLFGIKAGPGWGGGEATTTTHEYVDGVARREQAAFRSYGSVGEAFDDYVAFIEGNPRYAEALRHGGDARHYVEGLQKAGYATDPAYARKIANIAYGRTLTDARDAVQDRSL